MRTTISCVTLLLCAAMRPATADDAGSTLLAQLRKQYPATRFDGVQRTPIPRLYEVKMGSNVAFVDRTNLRYMVFGHMVDVRSMRDLTAERMRKAPADGEHAGSLAEKETPVDIKTLPLADAVPLVLGTGARQLVVFTDPGCGYCRQLDKSLRALRDVTIHHFIVPFQGTALPEAIWCAPDRAAAYARAMAQEPVPDAVATGCAKPLERNLALAARLGIRATPALLFADGRKIAGVISGEDIEARLAAAAGSK